MALTRPTLTRQIILGYLILAIFSLSAVGYALLRLRDQAQRSESLLSTDLAQYRRLQELSARLKTEETESLGFLAEQAPGKLVSLAGTVLAIGSSLEHLSDTADTGNIQLPAQTVAGYRRVLNDFLQLCHRRELDRARQLAFGELDALRHSLAVNVERLADRHLERISDTLTTISREGSQTYQVVLILVICGILLAALTGVSLYLYLSSSLQTFARMIRDFGAGSFNIDLEIDGNDEFSRLAREMRDMGRRLREMEEMRLDANPLTRLPGNLAISKEIEARIERDEIFAHAFADLDHFKAYNDRYGYQRGSDVISMTGNIIREAVARLGNQDDMIGHIGGDDYIYLTSPERAEDIAREIIRRFDEANPEFYTEEDRNAGCFIARDRFGEERRFPLLSISIAIVLSSNFSHPTPALIGRECARIKEYLKDRPGSCFLLDRRHVH